MAEGKLIIFAAVRAEARAIERGLRDAGMPPLQVCAIGIGGVHMPQFPAGDVRGIVLAGLAGGLDPSLKTGNILIDDRSTAIAQACRYVRGKIYTSPTVVNTPVEKAALRVATGAQAVEMEGDLVASAADRLGVPFLGVRAICDTATDAIDPAILDLVDEYGQPRPLRIAAALLRRPGLMAMLDRLRKASHAALTSLARALPEILVAYGLGK